tara:strand:+ start:638 stop:1165 length:528 start_codon:yes stop_codon:yes gene_type:complete
MHTVRTLTALFAIGALSACASPEVTQTVSDMDHRLSCAQIEHEIRQARALQNDAEDRKGFTLRNVVTTAAFFPITMATYSNADEAIDASQHRQKHLMDMYANKGCAYEGYAGAPGMMPMAMMMPVPMQGMPAMNMRYTPASAVSQTVITEEGELESRPRKYSDEHIHAASYLFTD